MKLLAKSTTRMLSRTPAIDENERKKVEEGAGEKALPALIRTCEQKQSPQRAASLDTAHRAQSHQLDTPRSTPRTRRSSTHSCGIPRPLLGGSFIGPAVASITSAVVPKVQRVCESACFIRMDYAIGGQLGAGRFANVRKGKSRLNGEDVAIKIFHRNDRYFDLDAVLEEIDVTRSLESEEHCVSLLAVYEDWEAIYLVLELAPGGCLSERMKAVQGKFTEHEAAIILAQVLKALDALHQKGIVHRDVKFDNILVMSNVVESEGYNLVKLCDFGLCTSLDKNCSVASICGTKQFWAPEIVKAIPSTGVKQGQTDTHYDVKVDIWALGVVFFTLLYGSEPFKNEPDQVLYSKIQRGANFASHSAISPGAQHLASWLLSVDPHRRPSAQEALQHPWLLEHMNPEWKAKDASASTQDNGSATHIAPLCVPTQVHCIAV